MYFHQINPEPVSRISYCDEWSKVCLERWESGTKKPAHGRSELENGGGRVIRTLEPITGTDLQSACFGRLHIPPFSNRKGRKKVDGGGFAKRKLEESERFFMIGPI